MGVAFDKSMIFKISGKKQNEEALSFLAEQLYAAGFVKEGYKEAILAREKAFPTGLYTGEINIAIPHADVSFVNNGAIAIGILDAPVAFRLMEDPDEEVPVSLVIMLALSEPHGHIDMLQKVVDLIKNQEDLKKITSSPDLDTVYGCIANYLL